MKATGVTKILVLLTIAVGMSACGGGQGSYATDESGTFSDDALADGGRGKITPQKVVPVDDGGRGSPVKAAPVASVPTGLEE